MGADRDAFQKNLDYFMRSQRVNQVELAKAVGVSKASVSLWLKGKSYPRIDVMEKIAKFFGVNISSLIMVRRESDGQDQEDRTDALHEQLQKISDEQHELFRLARTATPQALRAAVAMLKAMEENHDDY